MKFVWLDTAYDEAFRAIGGKYASYKTLFNSCFGTADAWDIALRSRGHESNTFYANSEPDILSRCAEADVICAQNVGRFTPKLLRERFGASKKLVGFCSYAADRDNLLGWDLVTSSFHWLVDELDAAGQIAVYLPLAFQKSVIERVVEPSYRTIDVSFVGGLGNHIWESGTQTMAHVAEEFPGRFQWFGYAAGDVPDALRRVHRGPVWGHQYYQTLMRSKITINRHGEIARGGSQNMRLYEATGCGSCLITDWGGNLRESFAETECSHYEDADHLCAEIEILLEDNDLRTGIAAAGKARTLRDHCYENRVDAFLEAVECL